MPATGTLSLHVRDQQVGQARLMTQPGKFGLGGGGLVIGRSAPSRWSMTTPASARGGSRGAQLCVSWWTYAGYRPSTWHGRRRRRLPASNGNCQILGAGGDVLQTAGRPWVLPPPKRGGHDPVESNQGHAFQP